MEKNYKPSEIETKWYKFWVEKKLFHSDATRGGEPYCIVIPPPNVTSVLHLGHALNNVIQDILIRWRRMQGRNVVWIPGTDHAGIATQNVVEQTLAKEGKSRKDLGREQFVKRVWEWKEKYGSEIINQLKRIGCSCDWQRERFTMDEGLSNAVQEVFVRLYNKGLIYRANYIINWCPRCGTALSDEESEHKELDGKLYYLRYKLSRPDPSGKQYIVVATTRPETLLGDVAVAINPKDNRYDYLKDTTVFLPILGRELKIVKDEFVDPTFGTGIVKVTPAHDPNDFEIGRKHGLDVINVMNGDGTMNENAGPYKGMDRFECRKRIMVDLEAAGLVERIENYKHSVGHCYRCGTIVEPRISTQWFVKMKPLAEPAIKAVTEGKIKFIPARWTKVYLEWMENIRDWCISRQIWWGHRIPVFTCNKCGKEWAEKGVPTKCPSCSSRDIKQDEDVLDTWFSSWLWPFSTFGWPEKNADMAFYYPTNDLVTASEIIFFWVARMIMAGYEFMGDLPFRTVYIHGTVRDAQGRKMSKSLGNGIDPLVVVNEYSADALRFSLMMITATGQDVFVSMDKFEIGRNFGTKLWNAARFIHMHSENFTPSTEIGDINKEILSSDDKHILAKMRDAIQMCTSSLEQYRFNDAAHVLYEFIWHQYCDWYLEYAKDILYSDDIIRKKHVLTVLHVIMSKILRLLHPFMPFITEELWHVMGYGKENDSIMVAPWPRPAGEVEYAELGISKDVVDYVEAKHEMIKLGRMLKLDYGIPITKQVDYIIKPNTNDIAAMLTNEKYHIKTALKAANVTIDISAAFEKAVPSGICALGTIFMPLEGLIDIDAELERLTLQQTSIIADIEKLAAKLGNASFTTKAPSAVVEQQKKRQKELLEQKEKLGRLISTLTDMKKNK